MVRGLRKSIRFSASAITIAVVPSGVKYRLYGSATGTGRPGSAGLGADRGEAVAVGVVHPQHRAVPGRGDVVGLPTDREGPDHLVGMRVDLGHRVAQAIRHIDPVRIVGPLRVHHAGPDVGVHIHRRWRRWPRAGPRRRSNRARRWPMPPTRPHAPPRAVQPQTMPAAAASTSSAAAARAGQGRGRPPRRARRPRRASYLSRRTSSPQ